MEDTASYRSQLCAQEDLRAEVCVVDVGAVLALAAGNEGGGEVVGHGGIGGGRSKGGAGGREQPHLVRETSKRAREEEQALGCG